MTIEQIIEMEPGLTEALNRIRKMNEVAKSRRMYFADEWPLIKSLLNPYVGYNCFREELRNASAWDTVRIYVERITPNMK